MTAHIKDMLLEAYERLGIRKVKELDDRVREAMAYLRQSRERYIEVAESDVAEYMITTNHGVICRQIPLAYECTSKKVGSQIRREVRVLSLIVSDTTARYMRSYYRSQLRDDPMDIVYSFPTCYFVQLEDITPAMHVTAPQRILPAATEAEWNTYCMVFTAMEKYCRHLPINSIPHKSERAMFALDFIEPEELTVDGKKLSGKCLLLAQQESLWQELREDHRYSSKKELYLLVQEECCQYILKTYHIYQYFNKVILDDTPGGCIYEPTKDNQEITWQIITPEAFPEDMYALYY